MEIDESNGGSGGMTTLDALLSASGSSILEEYQLKVAELQKDTADKNHQLKILQRDYE